MLLFALFAPITLPAYAIFLAISNLLGGAFYIVIEVTAARILRRPIALTRGQMAALALPVLLAAPLVTAGHMLIWLVRLVLSWLTWLGRWQAGTSGRAASAAVGAAWLAVAVWTTVTCLNAAVGAAWIGRPISGGRQYVDFIKRQKQLGEMPPDMQQRRREVIADLERYRDAMHPQWEFMLGVLRDDTAIFRWIRNMVVQRRIAGVPWYFDPAELSEDGNDHSELMLGPLILVWGLLIRWPGMFAFLPWLPLRLLVMALRAGLAAWAMYYLITWEPLTIYYSFWFSPAESMGGPQAAPLYFKLLSPALWLGLDYEQWVRPAWWLFNAGLWLALAVVLGFCWQAARKAAPLVGWPRYYVAFLASRLLQRKRIAFFSVGAVTLCVAMMIIVISVMGGFVDSIRNRAHSLLGDLVMDGPMQGWPYYQEFIDRISKLKDEQGRALVVQATPLIRTYGVLQFPNTKKTSAVSIVGIRLDEYVRVNKFGEDLFYNNRYGGTTLGPQGQPVYAFDERNIAVLPEECERKYRAYLDSLPPEERAKEEEKYRREPHDFYPGPGVFKGPEEKPGVIGKEYPGVIIGRNILFRRLPSGDFRRGENYPRGEACYLTVLPMTRGGDVSPEPPPKPTFRYVDDSRTGIYEIDSLNVYVDFDVLQTLLSMEAAERADGGGMAGARCTQIQIKAPPEIGDDRAKLAALKARIEQEWQRHIDEAPADAFEFDMLHNVSTHTWEEMQASFISAIEKEKFLVLIMFGVISIVAIFLILCIFYMIVQEKTRDIGIIKSVGGSAAGVTAVFLAYGGAIGLVGCILGSLLGTAFVEHINEIQDWLARINPAWRVWSPETYSFDKIPDVWKWSEVMWISVLAVAASIIGATFPALRAGRTWPVESLRYE